MIILKRLMTNTLLYLNTQYPFHPGSSISYCRIYEPRKSQLMGFKTKPVSSANTSSSFKQAFGSINFKPDEDMKTEAGNYTNDLINYGKNIEDYLLYETEINTRISQQTKINIKRDIALYDALAEVNQNASPESIETAKKQLLKLKEYTHLLSGGK